MKEIVIYEVQEDFNRNRIVVVASFDSQEEADKAKSYGQYVYKRTIKIYNTATEYKAAKLQP